MNLRNETTSNQWPHRIHLKIWLMLEIAILHWTSYLKQNSRMFEENKMLSNLSITENTAIWMNSQIQIDEIFFNLIML